MTLGPSTHGVLVRQEHPGGNDPEDNKPAMRPDQSR